MEFKFGDYVAYQPYYMNQPDIGRFISESSVMEDKSFVCFTSGCTAALTPNQWLRKATESEIRESGKTNIGFNRFEQYCPDYEDDCCYPYCPEKRGA